MVGYLYLGFGGNSRSGYLFLGFVVISRQGGVYACV